MPYTGTGTMKWENTDEVENWKVSGGPGLITVGDPKPTLVDSSGDVAETSWKADLNNR